MITPWVSSGGQQQRLVIASAIAIEPEVILLDEPASALDPISTLKIEELINELKDNYTIVIVTHNMQQAARVSDYHGFYVHGRIDRIRRNQRIIHQPGKKADRRLYYRQIRIRGDHMMDSNKIKQHISRQFNEEMEDIRNKVLTMGGLVEQQVNLATKAFMSYDMESAEMVVQQDQLVNGLEKNIDHECSEIMAKRQPAAFDLRMLIATIKIITDLERIGDEAARIARMTMRLEGSDYYQDKYYEIEHLLEMVKEMLNGALDAYARTDVEEVIDITAQDTKVDREYTSIARQMITQMMENPSNITRALDMLWTARALERIGDHSCNICEHVIYMVKGKDVRHVSREELEKTVKTVR